MGAVMADEFRPVGYGYGNGYGYGDGSVTGNTRKRRS